MADPKASSDYLNRLRQWRTRPDRDVSLGFLKDQFKREVEKPYKQLHAIAEIWEELVPESLAAHVRLESLSRGILRVAVDSSPARYELDRLLRGGMEQELIVRFKGPAFRSVKVRVASFEDKPDPRRQGNQKGKRKGGR